MTTEKFGSQKIEINPNGIYSFEHFAGLAMQALLSQTLLALPEHDALEKIGEKACEMAEIMMCKLEAIVAGLSDQVAEHNSRIV